MPTFRSVLPTAAGVAVVVAVAGVFLVRIGTVAEGQAAPVTLRLTTDVLLPVVAGLWVLAAAGVIGRR